MRKYAKLRQEIVDYVGATEVGTDVRRKTDKSLGNLPSPMRAAVRFPLHLPVSLHVDGGLIEALTEDISSTGACFLSQVAPRVGSLLEWNLRLPAAVMGMPNAVEIDCVGRVVWTRVDADGVRVGALIDDYQLKEERA
jgi:hypothetical protein